MFRHNYGIRKALALPLYITWESGKSAWAVMIAFLCFYYQVIHINMPKPEDSTTTADQSVSKPFKMTKAYADERQKLPRSRRRKRSKHSPYKV